MSVTLPSTTCVQTALTVNGPAAPRVEQVAGALLDHVERREVEAVGGRDLHVADAEPGRSPPRS
jgi:hypothetical protein